MAQYIDKDKAITDIEKAIDEPAPSHDQQCRWEDGYYCGLYKAEGIIDTLEVKEVDLEEEVDKFFNIQFGVDNGYFSNDELFSIAKHFFELGITVNNKAQKGE